MVGEGTHRDEVDAGLGIAAQGLFGDASAGFGLVLPVNTAHGLAQGVGVKIVEHDAVHTAVAQHLLQLVEVAYLDFYFQVFAFFLQVGMCAVYGCLDAAGKVDVVVLEHDHIVEPNTVVGAAAALHGVFLQQTHVGRGLAGVEQLCVQSVEHTHHFVRLCGDAAEPLHEVEGCAFGCEDHSRSTLYRHQDITLFYGVAILFMQGDGEGNPAVVERVVYKVKHSFAYFHAANDTLRLCNHFGCVSGGWGDTCQSTVVAVAHIFEQCHTNQFV